MLTSLSLIFIVGLSMAFICRKIKLPRIIGMLITGIELGPYVLDFLDSKIHAISSELRQMALIIIFIKAGLTLSISDLKKVGRPAILFFFRLFFEIGAFVILAFNPPEHKGNNHARYSISPHGSEMWLEGIVSVSGLLAVNTESSACRRNYTD